MKKVIIYLTNLSHVHNNIFSMETIPLNIGYLTAYAKKIFSDEIEVKLFNVHTELNEAIKRQKPHILGGSNYIWNSNLSYHYLSYYKKQHPSLITVMGGPSFSYRTEGKQDFFAKRKYLDFYIEGEGEHAFNALLTSCLKHHMDIEKIKNEELPNCNYMLDNKFISHSPLGRITHLDDIPSPYLSGLLDKFLAKGLTPILQTNRGCPFSCAYCCSSLDYYNKVSFFDKERVKNEIEYIAKRVKSPSIHIHDDNFGMFAQDYEICQKFKDVQKKYGWPTFISAATGKNVKENILRCAELLGSSIVFSLSVQSTNSKVLKNIGRINIHLKDFWDIQEKLKTMGNIKTHSELILPLPGETSKSYLEGIKTLMSLGVDSIGPYTTMLLPGSHLNEERGYDEFRITKKYRIIPRNFGKYEKTNIVEIEKIAVATNDLSLEDYIFLRGFNLIIYCFYNGDTFKELIRYLESAGIGAYDFCYKLYGSIKTAPDRIKTIFMDFIMDANKELWDSEEEICEYYSKERNFRKLLTQDTGYNLLQRYQGLLFANYFKDFLEFAIKIGIELLKTNGMAYDMEALMSLSSYILNKRGNIFNAMRDDIVVNLTYDIPSWIKDRFAIPITKYKRKITLRFFQTKEQRSIIRKYVKIYDDTPDGRGRILTRVDPEKLFKKISKVNLLNRRKV